jgi:hypothetical protein
MHRMTAWESPWLAIVALLVVMYLAYSAFLVLRELYRNPLPFFEGVGILAAIAVGIVVIAAFLVGGAYLYSYGLEQATLKKCLTAHERRAYAIAAPDDYFGRQLREAADMEAKTCAELATKKQAEAAKAHGPGTSN